MNLAFINFMNSKNITLKRPHNRRNLYKIRPSSTDTNDLYHLPLSLKTSAYLTAEGDLKIIMVGVLRDPNNPPSADGF